MSRRVSWTDSKEIILNPKDSINTRLTSSSLDELSILKKNINIAILTLKKPTGIMKIVDAVPKPISAVPENGLPIWYKLHLDQKLPVPRIPAGKVVLTRGKVGEDIRRQYSIDDPEQTMGLMGNDVTFEYSSLHDPHLVHHFMRNSIRKKMIELGLITDNGMAVCSLKEFNKYRQYLNNQYKNHTKIVIRELDEQARTNLILQRTNEDMARRLKSYKEQEKTRTRLKKVAQWNSDKWEEKKRLVTERSNRAVERVRQLAILNDKIRGEKALRAEERRRNIRERQKYASDWEVHDRIVRLRDARVKEEKRQKWLKQEKESREKKIYEKENAKWEARLKEEAKKIQEEEILLKIYTETMAAAAARRAKKAQIKAYETDLELQKIRLRNIKILHGEERKRTTVAKKMKEKYEKTICYKSFAIPQEAARQIARDATASAMALPADRFVTISQARCLMFKHTELPSCVVSVVDEIIQAAVMEFARRLVKEMLHDVETEVYANCARIFFADAIFPIQTTRNQILKAYSKKSSKKPRWRWPDAKKEESIDNTSSKNDRMNLNIKFDRTPSVHRISLDNAITTQLKSVDGRKPTPVPSLETLARISFISDEDELPDPTFTTINSRLPERRKLLEMIQIAEKMFKRCVQRRVEKGMDTLLNEITLPSIKRPLEFRNVVETIAQAVVDNHINPEAREINHIVIYISYRIMLSLLEEKRARRRKLMQSRLSHKVSLEEVAGDFYRPKS